MPTTSENEIIELTDVVEEGHPDQPNLPPRSSSPASDKVLDDLDLEKEIDQIFADLGTPLGTPQDEGASNASEKSLDDDLDLDDLFGASEPPSRKQPKNVQEEQSAQQAAAEPPLGNKIPAEMAEPEPKTPLSVEPEAPAHASPDADQLALLVERLAVMEEKVTHLTDAQQVVSEQIETRLSLMAQEFADKLREQADSLQQELRSELERDIGQMVRDALEEANAQHMEEFSRQMAVRGEETVAQVAQAESRIQELRNLDASAGQSIPEAVASQMEELRAGLLQELQEAIPAAAARIIREEIQALTQED